MLQNYPHSIKKIRLAEMDKQETTAKTSAIIQSGFIAHDVAAAAKKIDYYFNGVHAPENPTDNWSLSYEKLVVPLVKAVQELSKRNDEKDVKINNLGTRLSKLEALMNVQSGSTRSESLQQNN
jgi:hypothetical protein